MSLTVPPPVKCTRTPTFGVGRLRSLLAHSIVFVLLCRLQCHYQSRAREAAQVIEELIELAKEMRAANALGEQLGLSHGELAFYDALEPNYSAMQVLGEEILRSISRELVDTARNNVSIGWTLRENGRAKLQAMVKRILRKHVYSPDGQEKAKVPVLELVEVLLEGGATVLDR